MSAPSLLLLAVAATVPMSDEATRLTVKAADLAGRLLALVLMGALTFGVIESLRGRPPGMVRTLSFGLRSAGRVFVVSFVTGIAIVVGLLLCVVPSVFIFCMLWVAVPVAVIEDTGIRESMERSSALTSGTRLRVFALTLVMILILIAGGVVVFAVAYAGVFAVASILGGASIDELSAPMEAAAQLLASILFIPLECLYAATPTVGYHDLRVHREGADVEDLVRVFE